MFFQQNLISISETWHYHYILNPNPNKHFDFSGKDEWAV